MRAKALVVVSVVALIFALASAVAAQYSDDKSPVGFRALIFKPTGAELKGIKTTWFGPVLDWNVKFDQQDRPSLVISGGWLGQSSSTAKGNVAPVTATYLHHFGNTGNSFYAGAGIGVYFVKYSGTVYPYTSQLSANGHPLGLNFTLGHDFGPWFLEVDTTKVSTVNLPGAGAVDFSGIEYSLGSHFTF